VSLMPMSQGDIEELLKKSFEKAYITVTPLAADSDHYAIEISAECFRGKNRVEQHRMVYQALEGHSGSTIHAVALTTKVPD
jgi:stress-induced morphogen